MVIVLDEAILAKIQAAQVDINVHVTATINVTPFYRFRHFGGRPNFPFDYIDTKFQLYGVQATVGLSF